MTEAPKLLPCPFCGGKAEIVEIDEGENAGGSCVCCTRCMASGNVEFERKENFVSNWNRRALTPEAIAASPEGQALIAAARLVKPLVWSRTRWGHECQDREYTICREVDGYGVRFFDMDLGFIGINSCDNPLEEAKEVAKDHRSARILAALEPAPDALAALERIKAEAREEGRKAGLLEAAGMITLGDTVTRTQARILAATETPA